jgi:Zn-dependent protease/CBS domain-containing protein
MRWSLKLGEVKGIKVFVHWTFSILLLWVFAMKLGAGEDLGEALEGVGFILALFGCVFLHELGHALAARRYGITTRDITLLPIGGIARLERMPRDPKQELVVALAGPAVNVAIAGLLFTVLLGIHGSAFVLLNVGGNFFHQLMWVNMFLVAFNLIPAFPMDGGRVLRALLARAFDYVVATTIAARVGQVLAVVLGVLGLLAFNNPAFGSPMLVLIAAFVFFGAQSEAQMVRLVDSIRGVPVHEAMMTRFRALLPEESLRVAAQELVASAQHDFPVIQDDRVVGVLRRADLVRALADGRADTRIGEVMQPTCEVVADNDQLERPYELLKEDRCSSVPVVRDGRLVGLITLENILDWVVLHTALRRRWRPA